MNNAYDTFIEKLMVIIEKTCAFQETENKKNKNPLWMTSEILDLICERNSQMKKAINYLKK